VGIASTGTTTNRFRYLGKLGYVQEDTLAGALLRRRYYQYEIGRFVSRDPLRDPGRSEYGYAWNAPTVEVDPGGLSVGGVFKCHMLCAPLLLTSLWAPCIVACTTPKPKPKVPPDREALKALMQRMFRMAAGQCCPDTTPIGPILDAIEAPEKREAVEQACITDLRPLCAAAQGPPDNVPDSADCAAACYGCCLAIASAAGIDFAKQVCEAVCMRKFL
jgi:RHS repeat-associated protein